MTIASEISRLQTDKECMRQAIIDKGVDVAASVSLDDYAACIADIPTGAKTGYIDFLMVGGGGGGGGGFGCCYVGGGGGAGGFVEKFCQAIYGENYPITIGMGGAGGTCTNPEGDRGGTTTFYGSAYGGGGGSGCACTCANRNGASGGGGDRYHNIAGVSEHIGQGYDGGKHGYAANDIRGGGGGAGGAGEGVCRVGNNLGGGTGGIGKASSISGVSCYYAGGGGGGNGQNNNAGGAGGCGGGGKGGCCAYEYRCGCNATYYGGGGGGGACCGCGGAGCQGVVIIRYKSDGSCGVRSATGGDCCYLCNGYCVHIFTSDGVFTPIL